ncbi:MAG: hypothetical protein IKS15_01125 [Opitutales bacterium]|nr:hypothetical protein [Opitutales bacterium]
MKYSFGIFWRILAAAAALLAAGIFAAPLGKIAAGKGAKKSFGARSAVFAMLGGYRQAAADFVWIKAYLAWERRDYQKCLARIELATEIDPENVLFWNLGAGIIAYDTPHWFFDSKAASPAIKKSIRRRQAKVALEFLDRGLKANPESRRLKLDKALIYEKVLGDMPAALACHKAACDDAAPIYVVRGYAGMLEDCGKPEEALNLLRARADKFDKNHPSYEFYLEHIRHLENKLKSQKNILAL